MKQTKFTVSFTTHVLANGMTAGSQDKFQRDLNNRLIFQQSWFYAAFNQALKIAKHRGIKPADIHMDLIVDAPTVMYERKYGEGREEQRRMHETIPPGTLVTFEAVVADHLTESTLKDILDKMGRFVGLSPYGHNLGYGRFNVVSVEVASSDEGNTGTTQADRQAIDQTQAAG